MKKVSILQSITDFAERTDDPVAKDHLLLLKLARKVEREINTFRSKTLKAVLVHVEGDSTPMPNDAFRIDKIYPGDLTDEISNYYKDIYTSGVQYDKLYDQDVSSYVIQTDFVWRLLDRHEWIDTKLWDIVNDTIVFPSGYSNQELTIFYQAWETDELGYLLVNESHINAISLFFKFYFAERSTWKSFRSKKMMRQGELGFERGLKRDYLIARGSAKSQDLERTPMDRREIDGIY